MEQGFSHYLSLRPRPVKANSQITEGTESLAAMKPLQTFLSHGFGFFRKWHSLCCHPLPWNLHTTLAIFEIKPFKAPGLKLRNHHGENVCGKPSPSLAFHCPLVDIIYYGMKTDNSVSGLIAFCLNTCFFSTLFLCQCQQNLDPKQSHKEQNTTSHRELKIRKLLSHNLANFWKIWSSTRKRVNFNSHY